MRFTVESLLVALCVMSVTITFANTSLQIQDQPDTFPGAIGANSIFEQYMQMKEDMVNQAFNDPFFKQISSNYPKTRYKKTKSANILTFVTPGMSKENISVTLNNKTLTVSGKYNKKTEKKDNSANCEEEEVSKQFSQSINIPDDVITSKISSKYENGILTVTLPKDIKKVEENIRTIKIE